MRSAENVLWLLEDRRHQVATPALPVPKSFSTKPAVFAPHPPLVSGGWYNGAGQEVVGPGRYPVRRPADKSVVAALLWTLFFGPLGLLYLSITAGVLTTALTVGAVVMTGSAVVLAVVWPVAMMLSLIYATDRR